MLKKVALNDNAKIEKSKIFVRVTSDLFEKNQVQFNNNSRIFQVHISAAIFPYTTKYYDRQAHLKLFFFFFFFFF